MQVDSCGLLHARLDHLRREEVGLPLALHCDFAEILLRQSVTNLLNA